MTPEQQQQWMAQWRRAAVELERVKREELARMTAQEALRTANDLLDLALPVCKAPRFQTYSSLVKQQKRFRKLSQC